MAVVETVSSGLRLVCASCRHEIPLAPAAVLIGSPNLDCPKCGYAVLDGGRHRQPRP